MDVIEAMETCSAARYLKPDPVPQELIERVIYAATRASSPGNSQAWDFIVVRDRETKRKIRDLIAPRFQAMRAGTPASGQVTNKMLDGAMHLADSLHEVPAIIFVCGPVAYPPNAPLEQFVWSALYPAAQNLIVAARSLGLGTTFTTFHMFVASELRELLGIPSEVRFGVMIPIGWPQNEFVKVKRKPIAKVIHWDKWSD
ncbi:MAG: nitroreductase family protein [Candidatus Binataceae bacterium]